MIGYFKSIRPLAIIMDSNVWQNYPHFLDAHCLFGSLIIGGSVL